MQGGEFLLTRLSTEVALGNIRTLVVFMGEHDNHDVLLLEAVEHLARLQPPRPMCPLVTISLPTLGRVGQISVSYFKCPLFVLPGWASSRPLSSLPVCPPPDTPLSLPCSCFAHCSYI